MPALKPKIKPKPSDLFLCDLADASLKDDMASMEHPIFTISKKPDMVARVYEHNGNTLRTAAKLTALIFERQPAQTYEPIKIN